MVPATPNRSLVESTLTTEGAARMTMYVFLALLGTLALAVAARVQVPFSPVPATLQTLALFTLSAAFGRKLAVATVLLYILEGALGAPVFAKGSGLAYLTAGPTTGYLAGFVVAAAITGYAADKGYDRNPFKLAFFMLIGEAFILALGAGWLAYIFGTDKAYEWGVGPFILIDLVKIAIAAALVPALWATFRRPDI